MMKRIMILGAGRGQVDLIKAAKTYGYSTVVASIRGDWPGFSFADECCFVDISDPKAVLDAARLHGIDGIATACLDTGIMSLGYVCDELGLCGLTGHAAQLSSNKWLMKEAFVRSGVSTAKFRKIFNRTELEDAAEALSFPLIVKAVDLQGSRGINIVRHKNNLLQAYDDTMAESKKDFCIVEEFIEGKEFGAQAFMSDGELVYLLPCGDITYEARTNIPVGHYAPLPVSDAEYNEIYAQVLSAIKAVGLDDCAVNADLIKKDGRIYVIEITGRVGANCLPEIVSTHYGIDVYKMILEKSLGMDVKNWFDSHKQGGTACYAKMLYATSDGILKAVVNRNKADGRVIDTTFFVKPGDAVRKFSSSKDCLGQIVVKGNSVSECGRLMKSVESNITFEVV